MLKVFWDKLFERKGIFPEPAKRPELEAFESSINVSIHLEKGSITKIPADVIVNSAGPSLIAGGGLDWAIHASAGKELQAELLTFGGCEEGHVVVTKGYRLPCTHIIHTVTPTWLSGLNHDVEKLRFCYRNIFKAAEGLGARSLAIPAIGTGVHEIPVGISADIVKEEISAYFTADYAGCIEELIFVLFSNDDFNTYSMTFERPDVILFDQYAFNTRSYPFAHRKLILKGNFVVNVVPSKINKITAHVKGMDLDDIDTVHEGEAFVIESGLKDRIVLHVASADLDQVIFAGEGTLEFEDEYREFLDLDLSGDIDAKLIGLFDNLNIKVTGDGTINASMTKVKNLWINQKGVHEIHAHASQFLSLTKEGFGDIHIKGTPKTVETLDEGVGSIKIS